MNIFQVIINNLCFGYTEVKYLYTGLKNVSIKFLNFHFRWGVWHLLKISIVWLYILKWIFKIKYVYQ